jgi:quinol monooxygenase YgiN
MKKLSPVLFGLVMFVGACAIQQDSTGARTSGLAGARASAEANRHGSEGVVSLVVTMTVKAEREQEFLDLCRAYAAYVHTHSAGVLLYTLNKDPELEHTYVWIERYANDDAIRSKGATAEYKAAVSQVIPLLAKPPVGRRLVQVAPK